MIPQLQIEKGIPIPPPCVPRPEGSCKCGQMPRKGYKTCDTCLDEVKQSYRKRRAKGMCGYGTGCSERAAEGHSMCAAHLRQNNTKIRELLDGRVAQGLCRRCGFPRIPNDNHWCADCRISLGYHPLPHKTRIAIREFWRTSAVKERREFAASAIDLLRAPRMKTVLRLRHGLIDGVDHTLESVGIRLGVTRERVRQIENKAYGILIGLGADVSFRSREPERPPIKDRDRLISPLRTKKDKAHQLVTEAIKSGALTPGPCKDLNDDCKGRVLAHHPDYDKPLDVEWVCRRHHAVAHGKSISGLGEQKILYTFPSWLERAKRDGSSTEYYDAPAILEALIMKQVPQGVVSSVTGVPSPTLAKIVRGLPVNMQSLLKVRRYIETLKAEQAA